MRRLEEPVLSRLYSFTMEHRERGERKQFAQPVAQPAASHQAWKLHADDDMPIVTKRRVNELVAIAMDLFSNELVCEWLSKKITGLQSQT